MSKQIKKSAKERREHAQDELIHYAASAFYAAADQHASEEDVAELRKQYERLCRFFGLVEMPRY